VRRRIECVACGLGLLAAVGCAGQGDQIPIQVQLVSRPSEQVVTPAESLRVLVYAFEDGRDDKTRLGTRTHVWGGVSYFNVPGLNPGEAMAKAIADYLGSKGWQAEVVTSPATRSDTDVVLRGKILDLTINAKGRFGSTKLTTTTKLAIQAKNLADGSEVRMTLNGSGSDSVFWFDPEDAQALVNDVLRDSVGKLIQDSIVENKLLRLK
jgi:hypothetical protein